MTVKNMAIAASIIPSVFISFLCAKTFILKTFKQYQKVMCPFRALLPLIRLKRPGKGTVFM
jgi:hypothetical protein